jgi:hypothetical protein
MSFSRLAFLTPTTRTRLAVWSVLVFSASVLCRAVYRGSYYPGWDTLGPAHGLYLVSTTGSFVEALQQAFELSRHYWIWNHTNSVLYTLIPGYLGSVWPWEFWGHLLTFALFALTLWVLSRLHDLPLRESWIVLLVVSTSPAILSFSIAGYPFVTGFLPHALTLWITLHDGLRRRAGLSFLVAMAVMELSWHLYPLGKTAFTVLVAGAVLLPEVPPKTRATWLLVSAVQIAMILTFSSGEAGGFWAKLEMSGIAVAARAVLKAEFVSQTLATPFLVALGAASFLFLKRHRLFLFGLLALQLALIGTLAFVHPDELRPRRALVAEFYCVVAVLSMLLEDGRGSAANRRAKLGFVLLLVLGDAWQLYDMAAYMRVPVRGREYPLPHTFSQADYKVPATEVDWSRTLRSKVEAGEKLFLIYNFDAYPENTTDMAGVLERLYISLGHDKFVESVFVFGDTPCRYACLPIKRVDDLPRFSGPPLSADSALPERIQGYYALVSMPGAWGWKRFTVESARIFANLRKRFRIDLDAPRGTYYAPFTITVAGPATPSALVDVETALYHGQAGTLPFAGAAFPLDVFWFDGDAGLYDAETIPPHLWARPWGPALFSLRMTGTLHVLERGYYRLFIGADDSARVRIDGQVALENGAGYHYRLAQRGVLLEAGRHPLEIEYEDFGGLGRLLVDLQRVDDRAAGPATRIDRTTVPMTVLFPRGLEGTYYLSTGWSGEARPTGDEIHLGESLEAAWKATAESPSRKPWGASDFFSLRLQGTAVIPESGIYRIVLGSDDGSTLHLDGRLVVDNFGVHPYREEEGLVFLDAGPAPFRLDYVDAGVVAKLRLTVERVGAASQETAGPAAPR